ncbi:MAG: kelch repeat-containing protein [Candidatus Limnocylindrales bacterium]
MTTDRPFDALLRSWFEESAPSDAPQGLLESVVTATAHSRPRPPWLVRLGGEPMPQAGRAKLHRLAPVALAATAVVVAVLLIGTSLLVGTPDVSPSPIPSPSNSAAPERSATPVPTVTVPATWIATGAMIEARAVNTATLLADGKVLVAGGETGGDASKALASAELYDPRTGTWTATGSMNEARTGHAAVLLPDGKVLVVGGARDFTYFPSHMLTSAELYDPRSGTWTVTASLHAVRRDHVALLLPDGTVLVVGGTDGGEPYPAAAERYDPVRGTWTVSANMIENFPLYAAASLSDGTVLIVGEADGGAGRAELYDPDRRIWSATGNVIEPHCGPVDSVLLRTGKVLLICGHLVGTPEPLAASTELYDPDTGTWTLSGSMQAKSDGATAVLLADGRVLGVAMTWAYDTPQSPELRESAELYDPIAGTWTATASLDGVFVGGQGTVLLDGTVLFAGGGNGTGVVASSTLFDRGSGS